MNGSKSIGDREGIMFPLLGIFSLVYSAGLTLFNKPHGVRGNSFPMELTYKQTVGSPEAEMAKIMERSNDLLPELSRQQNSPITIYLSMPHPVQLPKAVLRDSTRV
jgi:hypothetical protein